MDAVKSRSRCALVILALALGCSEEDPKDDTALSVPVDADGDGFEAAQECDDSDPAINPDATEVCDGVDNDCDGLIDDDDPSWDPGSGGSYHLDADADGFGDAAHTADACDLPDGYVEDATDCDDGDPDVHPGATEHCDGVDEDCDGEVDEEAVDSSELFTDADDDGWGVGEKVLEACGPLPGLASQHGDCDDEDASVYPGAVEELYDGIDQDCDGYDGCESPTWYVGDLTLGSSEAAAEFCDSYTAVCGDLQVQGDLEDLEDLSCVTVVTGDLYFRSLPAIEATLPGLIWVGGSLIYEDAPDVKSIALPELEVVLDALRLSTSGAVSVPELEQIGGELVLSGVEDLDFASLERVDGRVQVDCPGVVEAGEFPVLIEVGGALGFEDACHARNVTSWSFPVLERVGSLGFADVSRITVEAPQLLEIGSDLGFYESEVTSLILPLLEDIGGDLRFHLAYEEALSLPALRTVGGSVDLAGAYYLESLELPALEEVLETFTLCPGPIGDLSLPSLVSAGTLYLSNNGTVEAIDLPSLSILTRRLVITSGSGLSDLSGLSALRVVGEYVTLTDNVALVDLTGLHGVESVGGSLTITGNTVLPDAQIEDLVLAIGEENIGGEVTIYGNGG